MRAQWPSVLITAASLLGGAGTLSADPPDRVARLSYIDGSVSFRPAELEEWGPATRNYPLTIGDHLWTDRRSRAELRTDFGAVRLGPETAVSLLNLDDQTAQIRLAQGSVELGVRDLDEDSALEVATPSGAVAILRRGAYRIDVSPGGDETTVTVRRGEAQFTFGDSSLPVRARESLIVNGIDEPNYDVLEASPLDSWEEWCDGRDRALERSVSTRYVSPGIIGYEELDTYGRWREEPGYGAVWIPSEVVVGWSPYHYGHWAWVAPWGWTWVDDAPWGFAPFHYGRWAYVGGAWGWVPGTIVARPVYAPALVAWVGGSSWHASLSIGGGGVAWFPLGPREVYVPPYQVSPTYIRQVNVTHVNVTNVNITNINTVNTTYANQAVPGAVTAVSRENFVSARPVAAAAVTVPPRALAGAPVVATLANVQPQRESIVMRSTSAAVVAHPPTAVMNRAVAAHLAAPPPPALFSTAGSTAVTATSHPLVRTLSPQASRSVALRPARTGLPAPQPATAGRPTLRTSDPGAEAGRRNPTSDSHRVETPASREGSSAEPHHAETPARRDTPAELHKTETPSPREGSTEHKTDSTHRDAGTETHHGETPAPREGSSTEHHAETPAHHEGTAAHEAARPAHPENPPHKDEKGGGKPQEKPKPKPKPEEKKEKEKEKEK